MPRHEASETPARTLSGRRVAFLVILVAFVASATTAMLAFTLSHRTIRADAAAMAADDADLRGVLSEWHAQWQAVDSAAPDQRAKLLLALPQRSEALSAWKPRTPCGGQIRDQLGDAMRQRIGWLERRQAGQPEGSDPDEEQVLANALHACQAAHGGDVTT